MNTEKIPARCLGQDALTQLRAIACCTGYVSASNLNTFDASWAATLGELQARGQNILSHALAGAAAKAARRRYALLGELNASYARLANTLRYEEQVACSYFSWAANQYEQKVRPAQVSELETAHYEALETVQLPGGGKMSGREYLRALEETRRQGASAQILSTLARMLDGVRDRILAAEQEYYVAKAKNYALARELRKTEGLEFSGSTENSSGEAARKDDDKTTEGKRRGAKTWFPAQTSEKSELGASEEKAEKTALPAWLATHEEKSARFSPCTFPLARERKQYTSPEFSRGTGVRSQGLLPEASWGSDLQAKAAGGRALDFENEYGFNALAPAPLNAPEPARKLKNIPVQVAGETRLGAQNFELETPSRFALPGPGGKNQEFEAGQWPVTILPGPLGGGRLGSAASLPYASNFTQDASPGYFAPVIQVKPTSAPIPLPTSLPGAANSNPLGSLLAPVSLPATSPLPVVPAMLPLGGMPLPHPGTHETRPAAPHRPAKRKLIPAQYYFQKSLE